MSGIAWQRRVEYAGGFLQLGMVAEAAAELSAVAAADRTRPEVLASWCDVYSESKDWARMVEAGRVLARSAPAHTHGWISWAFALRELQQIAEARAVLLEAEPLHPASGVLHYNLACYACLLGDRAEATRRLAMALKLGRHWKASALTDPDLHDMRDEIAKL